MGVFRQFPYSNFHEMNMDEIIKIVKNMLEEWAQYYTTWDNWKEQVTQEWEEMQSFINNYFDNLDVQTEINNKIRSMVNSGEFSQIVDPFIPPEVSSWLAEHITTPETVVIDDSLTIEGAAADAKATGDAIAFVDEEINKYEVLETWYDYGDAIATPGKRYAYYSESDIGLVDYSGGTAYEINLHGSTSINLTGYYESSTKFIYQLIGGNYGTIDDLTTQMYRNEVIDLPFGAVKLFITLATDYDTEFKLKSLIPVLDIIGVISVNGSTIKYGVTSNTNQFDGYAKFMRQIDVHSPRVTPTFESDISGGISNWTGHNGATWDGTKWTLTTGATISKVISVTTGKTYLITLSVNNAYTPSETPVKQKIVFGTQTFEFFGANDANWNVAFTADTTDSISVTVGNTNWSGEITNITILPLEYKAVPAEYLNNRTLYINNQNIALGNGHSDLIAGSDNTAIGLNAQQLINTGIGNTAFGYLTQREINNGSYNVAVGQSAQQKIHTGMYNNAIGYASQQNIDDGCWNVAIGNESERDITSGCNNVGIGRRSLNSITTGSRNIAIGALAGFARGEGEETSLYETLTANDQILIGYQATQADDDAQYNNIIAIGSRARCANNGVAIGAKARAIGADSVAIGYMADATEDNSIVLGNTDTETLIVGNKRILFNNDGTVTWVSL